MRLLKQFVWGYLIGIALVAFVALIAQAHCTATKTQHSNSIGNLMYTDNPFTYKAGAVTNVAFASDGKGLVIRIQPIGTYSLFTEELLFCGDSVDMFLNQDNPMVLTYRTKASHMIEGVGCHELVNVSTIKPKERLK